MTANIIFQIALPPEIFLTDKFSPQKINIIFGRNGTGKSTIANLFYHTDRFTFGENNAGEDCEFFIFDKQFIEHNIQHYAGMPGIVTVSTQNAELLREQKALKEQLQEEETDIRILTDMISSLNKACANSDEQFREKCWRRTKELRKEFEKALSGKKTKQKFAEACVCISPQQQDKMKLSQLYDAVFISEIKPFPFYYMISDTMVLDTIDEDELLRTPLLGSGDSLFSAFMKKFMPWIG